MNKQKPTSYALGHPLPRPKYYQSNSVNTCVTRSFSYLPFTPERTFYSFTNCFRHWHLVILFCFCWFCIPIPFLDFTRFQPMGDFGGMHRPGIVVDYHNKPSSVAFAARGIKRKMIPQPYNKPGGTFIKKPKLTKPIMKMNTKNLPSK